MDVTKEATETTKLGYLLVFHCIKFPLLLTRNGYHPSQR
jgi:hypothetical protein